MKLKVFNITNCSFDYSCIQWTPLMLDILEQNWQSLTAAQLAKALKIGRSMVRKKLYELGRLKMEMEYFTEEQVTFLKENYQSIGDVEMAEIFENRWPKNKQWTHKHIRKKRVYLNLHRNEQMIIDIEQRNLDQGRLNTNMHKGKSNFLTSGPSVQFEIRMYRNTNGIITSRIRIGKRWVCWPRYTWEKLNGPVPAGYVVVMKDDNPFNTVPENLEIITKSDCVRRYASRSTTVLTDNYIAATLAYGNQELREAVKQNPQLIETKRTLLLFKREVKKRKDAKRKQRAA